MALMARRTPICGASQPSPGAVGWRASRRRYPIRSVDSAKGCSPRRRSNRSSPLRPSSLPASFFVASNVWIWLGLVASVLFVLIVEFLNTAVERLCNHVTPERHEAIRVTKDLASTAVFFALCLAGLVWLVAVLERFSLIT